MITHRYGMQTLRSAALINAVPRRRRALKHNAERFMRSCPSANCSCALRAHCIIRAMFKCPPRVVRSRGRRACRSAGCFIPPPTRVQRCALQAPVRPRVGVPQEAR